MFYCCNFGANKSIKHKFYLKCILFLNAFTCFENTGVKCIEKSFQVFFMLKFCIWVYRLRLCLDMYVCMYLVIPVLIGYVFYLFKVWFSGYKDNLNIARFSWNTFLIQLLPLTDWMVPAEPSSIAGLSNHVMEKVSLYWISLYNVSNISFDQY